MVCASPAGGAGGIPPPAGDSWPRQPPSPEASLQQLWLPVTKAGAPAASGLGTGGQNTVRIPRAQPKPLTRAASPDPAERRQAPPCAACHEGGGGVPPDRGRRGRRWGCAIARTDGRPAQDTRTPELGGVTPLGPALLHRELGSTLCNNLIEKRIR